MYYLTKLIMLIGAFSPSIAIGWTATDGLRNTPGHCHRGDKCKAIKDINVKDAAATGLSVQFQNKGRTKNGD